MSCDQPSAVPLSPVASSSYGSTRPPPVPSASRAEDARHPSARQSGATAAAGSRPSPGCPAPRPPPAPPLRVASPSGVQPEHAALRDVPDLLALLGRAGGPLNVTCCARATNFWRTAPPARSGPGRPRSGRPGRPAVSVPQ
ncbi:MAG: hypothetical protein MZU79_08840 [Anaerotruncus sp.]|nr:hypothetical protein [Anaerotruncus sp.]